jgi:hypothetical protein
MGIARHPMGFGPGSSTGTTPLMPDPERARPKRPSSPDARRPGVGDSTADGGYEHHVIGAVHEVVVLGDEAAAVAAAVHHELDECHAMRIVVDISAIDEVSDELLDALRPLAENAGCTAVRVSDESVDRMADALTGIGVADVITKHSPEQAGRAATRNGLTGGSQG